MTVLYSGTTQRSSASRRSSRELSSIPRTARETEAIREIGLELAIAVREVGAMLVNVRWEQSYAEPTSRDAPPT